MAFISHNSSDTPGHAPLKPYLHDMFWQTFFKVDQKTYCSYARLHGMFELSLIFPLQNNFLCLHKLNMEEDNFVIPACMLVVAAFCLINMNLSVSDGVKLNYNFLFLCRILNQVAKLFIENETHQWHVIFFICIIYVLKIPGKSHVYRCAVNRIPSWPYLRLVKFLEDTYVRQIE